MENKFKVGEVVRTKNNLNKNLIIRRYFNEIYYCTAQEDPTNIEVEHLERELTPLDEQNIGLLTSLNVIINKWNDSDLWILVK